MRKLLSHNNLASYCRQHRLSPDAMPLAVRCLLPTPHSPLLTTRAAFSLAELVVSVGVLILMLSLVGQVFHLTVKSTGQATALTEITQTIRAFEQTLREDLRGVQPGRSVLLIQAKEAPAYWTQAGRESDDNGKPDDGYPHTSDPEREDSAGNLIAPRADVLLFYTGRKGASYLHPEVTSNLQQIVYGHSEPGEFAPDAQGAMLFNSMAGPPTTANPDPFFASIAADAAPVPAQQWHLARRATLLLPTPAKAFEIGLDYVDAVGNPGLAPDAGMNNGWTGWDTLAYGANDVVGNFDYGDLVLRPYGAAPWFLPRVLDSMLNPNTPPNQQMTARSQMDATPPPILMNAEKKFYGMGHRMLPGCASFKVEWALDPSSEFVAGRLDGLGELLWFDPGDQVCSTPAPPHRDPLCAIEAKIAELRAKAQMSGVTTAQKNALDATVRRLDDLLYAPACEVDYTHYFAGFCTPNNPNSEPGMFYSLADRFRGEDDPNATNEAWAHPGGSDKVAVFAANRPRWKKDINGNSVPDFTDTVPDPMFPGALRITIDVFDDQQRLDRPVRHVMVIPIGG